jgi:hypothetical protein
MTAILAVMALQGILGGFDTVYYHEWRARLPARGPSAHLELRLHAVRDVLYAILFGSLPWVAWKGAWAWALAVVLLSEIAITLTDFVVEDRTRTLDAGERVTHAVMGIVYGAFLALLAPTWLAWSQAPTGFDAHPEAAPTALRWTLTAMSAGVLASGVRDLLATFGVRWPWKEAAA